MLNACLRCSTLFAGFFSLIQGIIWAGVCIWGISIYGGTSYYPLQSTVNENFHDISISYLFYISYLRGTNGPVIDQCQGEAINYEAPSAERTYIIMMVYSIISSIWVPTAAILIAGTCLGARGSKANWIYVPWIIMTAANCILDFCTLIVYVQDISKTLTTQKYLKFLDMTPRQRYCLGLDVTIGLDGYVIVPAIIMTILTSRGVFLWLLNLFFLIFGLQGICAFSKKRKPQMPAPYIMSEDYKEKMREQNHKPDNLQGQWIDFKRPEPASSRPAQSQVIARNQLDHGHINLAYVADQPLRLNPVEVEVKQERNNLKEVRYAEVEAIEMDMTPEEISDRNQGYEEIGPSPPSESSGHVSEAESVLPSENEVDDVIEEVAVASVPAPSPATNNASNTANGGPPRRVYDAYGNPTEERLTPRVARIQRIIENQITASQKGEASGAYTAKPFSYTQPQKPQVDVLPKKNDTVRGLEKPPIPVPDYSVRVTKKPSFRTPLPYTEIQNSAEE